MNIFVLDWAKAYIAQEVCGNPRKEYNPANGMQYVFVRIDRDHFIKMLINAGGDVNSGEDWNKMYRAFEATMKDCCTKGALKTYVHPDRELNFGIHVWENSPYIECASSYYIDKPF